ncbi:MAG TPA: CorA family divalent cation transporter, partial [Myxococcota bacterium]
MTEAEPLQLAHIGERPLDPQKITLIEYDEDQAIRVTLAEADIDKLPDSRAVRWLNIDGTPSEQTLLALGLRFNLHPLMIEDIASRTQRSKIEEYDDSIFIVMHMLSVDEKKRHPIASEQISIVLGRDFVLTFQQREGDVFDDVRARIKNATGRIRRQKADYLA